MTKRMLIDTTHAEETRVVVLDGNRLDDYDVETSAKKQIKGNIYLAKIVRIEPSLQAAFVEYGGNRHGFLAFSEIHPDYYQIPVADRERLIALQEEEARAEEARADREDEGGDDDAGSDDRNEAVRRDGGQRDGGQRDRGQRSNGRRDNARRDSGSRASESDNQDETPPRYIDADVPEAVHGTEAGHDFAADDVGADAPVAAHEHSARTPAADDAGTDAHGSEPDAPSDADEPHTTMSLEIDADTIEAEAEPISADGERFEDIPSDDGIDEPAPETVGGESGDDGQAQRRTARFLRQYKIQEVMRRRQILLIQVVKEERGNKGAALTTYISLAGRFCVLMPNSLRGGGVSRKITSAADRKRLKEITTELEIPRGMGMIVRTAGAQRPSPEIRRDCEYLLRTWDEIRETTLASVAPCLVYEEASLIKRAIRDVYTRDVEEIVVDGEPGWRAAREFMRTLMPSHANKVSLWRDPTQKLFSHHQVEHHLDAMLQPTVQLRSGGYLVINQTEALVAIDVNSGRSTRERSIEETAVRTNLEAADEVARQLRLRDLAGLIVIDFIDMESRRNNASVERRLKDALRNDRARIQVGSISHFGLMEMSRQRLRPSLAESSFVPCPHCAGSGFMRGTESSALHVLRAIEEEAGKRKSAEILVYAASSVALYVLNNKRAWLQDIEARHHLTVHLAGDDTLIPPSLRIEKVRPYVAPPEPVAEIAAPVAAPAPAITRIPIETRAPIAADPVDETWTDEQPDIVHAPIAAAGVPVVSAEEGDEAGRRRKRRRRRRGGRREDGVAGSVGADGQAASNESGSNEDDEDGESESVSETGEPGHAVSPVAASAEHEAPSPAPHLDADPATAHDAASAENAPRGRRRRGGGRNRPRPDGETASVGDTTPDDEAIEPRRPTRAYVGPTPADPFAGSFDIFEMIEREAEETHGLASNPSASAASLASAQAPTPAQAAVEATPSEPAELPAVVEPEVLPPIEPAFEPTTSRSSDPLGTSGADQEATPETKLPATSLAQTPPDSVADPVVDATPEASTIEADAEPAPKARKPRASRSKKASVSDDTAAEAAVPEAEAVAPAPEAVQSASATVEAEPAALDAAVPAQKAKRAPRKPAAAKSASVGTTASKSGAAKSGTGEADSAENAVADAAPSEPVAPVPAKRAKPVAAPQAPAPVAADTGPATDPSVVQPVVIGADSPAPARRTGWWKR